MCPFVNADFSLLNKITEFKYIFPANLNKFPVNFLGNFRLKALPYLHKNFKQGPSFTNFPVNSLLTGNLCYT